MRKFIEQFLFLLYDIKVSLGRNPLRIFLFLLSRSFAGIFIYRLERAFYLILGRSYSFFRIFILPITILSYWYSNCDIHYQAQIGKGLKILHPGLGIVISGRARIGDHLTLVGGNCIGINNKKSAPFILGNRIEMGVNSAIIGPIELGNNIIIGANSCVVKSYKKNKLILVGVPAFPLQVKENSPV